MKAVGVFGTDQVEEEVQKTPQQLLDERLDERFVNAIQVNPLNIKELQELIKKGANPNCSGFFVEGFDKGISAIHYLVFHKRYADLELFLEKIPTLFIDNAANQNDARTEHQIHHELQKTFTGYAQGNTRYDFLLATLRSKSRGGTALDFALRNKDARAVYILLKHGANIELLNNIGFDHGDGVGYREYSTLITNLWLYCKDDSSVNSDGINYLNLAFKEIIQRTPFEKLKEDLTFLSLDKTNTDPKYRSSIPLDTRRELLDFIIRIAGQIYDPKLLDPTNIRAQHNKNSRILSLFRNLFNRKSSNLVALKTSSGDKEQESQESLDKKFVAAIKEIPRDKRTPLDVNNISKLIEQGANPNCNKFYEAGKINHGSCAIHYLMHHKRYDDLDLFLTKISGIFVDNPHNQNDSRVDVLIHEELEKSISGYNPGNKIFELPFATLLNKRQSGSPLDEAMHMRDARAVYILIKHGANIEIFRDQAQYYGKEGGIEYSSMITDFFLHCKQDEQRMVGGEQYKIMAAREIISRTSFKHLCEDFNFLLMTKEEERLQLAYSTQTRSERSKQEAFEFMFTVAKEFYTPEALQEIHDKAVEKRWNVDARLPTPRKSVFSSLMPVSLQSPMFSAHTKTFNKNQKQENGRSREGSAISVTYQRNSPMETQNAVLPPVLEKSIDGNMPHSTMQPSHANTGRKLADQVDSFKKNLEPTLTHA